MGDRSYNRFNVPSTGLKGKVYDNNQRRTTMATPQKKGQQIRQKSIAYRCQAQILKKQNQYGLNYPPYNQGPGNMIEEVGKKGVIVNVNHSILQREQHQQHQNYTNNQPIYPHSQPGSYSKPAAGQFQNNRGEYAYLQEERQTAKINAAEKKRLEMKSLENQLSSKSNSNYPSGLPNIGNTCFLNSILQFMFGAAKFRDFLIASTKNITALSHKSQCYVIIGKLFQCLKEKSRGDDTKQLLSMLIHNLQSINMFYVKYRQEDALQTLLNLLNNIDESYPQSQPNQLFIIETSFRCSRSRCMTQEYTSESLYTSLQVETCSKCGSPFERRIVNHPEYIIYTNNSQDVPKMVAVNREPYQLVSQIMYMGSGRSGHYSCLRQENGVTYQLNDSSVTEKSGQSQYGYLARSSVSYGYNESYGSTPKLLLYLRKQTKNHPVRLIDPEEPRQTRVEDYQHVQYDPRKGKEALRDNQSTIIEKQQYKPNKMKQQRLIGTILLNQVYQTTINAACKILFTNNKIVYKPRQLFFQLVGNKNNYIFKMLNGPNYFCYQGNEKNLEDSIKIILTKYSPSSVTITMLIEKIEQKLEGYFKQKMKLVGVEKRGELAKLINEDQKHAEISFEELEKEAEIIKYSSRLHA